MIYDAFIFNGEWDLLDIRIAAMASLDIRHVLVESSRTFKGDKKDESLLAIRNNRHDDIRGIGKKLIVNMGDQTNPNSDPWQNEKWLRNSIVYHILDAKPDDIIIISDIDEIPRASAIKDWNGDTYAALMMDKFGFWLNCEEQHQGWHRARIMKYSYLKTTTPEEVRNAGFPEQIDNAGWHWSWLGGIDEVMRKFASFSHQEEGVQKHANREELIRKMAVGESIWGNDRWSIVPIDRSFPQYVQDHQQELKHLIFHG